MVTLIGSEKNIFNDDVSFVEQWDFSKANLNEENRINAITQIASVCYQNPKALNSDSLYNRLMAESIGLPSSSFEFVPILIHMSKIYYKLEKDLYIKKFGEVITDNGVRYLLTNFRALIYDIEEKRLDSEWLQFFNTEKECNIIKKYFKVFRYNVDLSTRSQMQRHRCSWQELSRRYVSGKRKEFDFYISEKMKDICILEDFGYDTNGQAWESFTTVQSYIDLGIRLYDTAIANGVKPEEARRILPQAMMTVFWGAWQPNYLKNFFSLRSDNHAQKEIRKVSDTMQELINKENNE